MVSFELLLMSRRKPVRSIEYRLTFQLAMNFASGLASGLIGALAVTPMDCIKTRIQKSGGISWMDAAKSILAEGRAQGGNSAAIQDCALVLFDFYKSNFTN